MKKRTVTLPELIAALGTNKVRQAMIEAGETCDDSLPRKWKLGSMPGWRKVPILADLADKNGMVLSIRGISHAR